MMERFICLIIGYAFGLFQTSYIIGKAHHIDIREVGSGNAGSTNTLRTFGTKAGLLTLLLDMLKCLLAVGTVHFLFQKSGHDILPLLKIYASAGCILGHNYPFYLNFRGGKGIAASCGMILALDWRLFFTVMPLFFLIFFTTHYVSLASLISYAFAFLVLTFFGALGWYGMNLAHTIEMDVVMLCLVLLAVFKHRENIRRLMTGTERKTYLGHKKTDTGSEK
ncbi:MAG: glycerol-3-phosphate 1-O-acyltransferase PlsY [Blautia sp.]|nr:glycerol-3-phosphate 1-O-acyltransferase PlsY [Blautia sp.]